ARNERIAHQFVRPEFPRADKKPRGELAVGDLELGRLVGHRSIINEVAPGRELEHRHVTCAASGYLIRCFAFSGLQAGWPHRLQVCVPFCCTNALRTSRMLACPHSISARAIASMAWTGCASRSTIS